ncbi:MAG: Uma2 family endonuclease [Cytophagales bacterium]|nr:Uma2 family endonuclease [Cytophagales bacterium]
MHTISLKIPPKIDVFSDDELYEFCRQNPDLRIERDENGQIFIKMPTGIKTSINNSELLAEVVIWNRRARSGKVTDAEGGYTLPDTAMRVPDVAWISNERLATVSDDDLAKFAHVCPDFVIELRSESDTLTELQEKMLKWLKNGVRLGWLIDPKDRKTYVYQPDREVFTKNFSETLFGEDVLAGFELNIEKLLH